jgi:hypothetical protein
VELSKLRVGELPGLSRSKSNGGALPATAR